MTVVASTRYPEHNGHVKLDVMSFSFTFLVAFILKLVTGKKIDKLCYRVFFLFYFYSHSHTTSGSKAAREALVVLFMTSFFISQFYEKTIKHTHTITLTRVTRYKCKVSSALKNKCSLRIVAKQIACQTKIDNYNGTNYRSHNSDNINVSFHHHFF